MQRQRYSFVSLLFILGPVLVAIAVGGCAGGAGDAPPLGEVTGTVTLDGKPLPGATVVFSPADLRDSIGTTDENGKYELLFNRTPGATIGNHTVRISKMSGGSSGEHAEGEQKETVEPTELIPAKYNTDSTETRDVQPGKNTFDFNLKSDGTSGKPEETAGKPEETSEKPKEE